MVRQGIFLPASPDLRFGLSECFPPSSSASSGGVSAEKARFIFSINGQLEMVDNATGCDDSSLRLAEKRPNLPDFDPKIKSQLATRTASREKFSGLCSFAGLPLKAAVFGDAHD